MNNRKYKKLILAGIMLFFFIKIKTMGQIAYTPKTEQYSDSLRLKKIIELVVTTNPSIKAAEETINNANARIGLAKSGYYPEADITGNFANIGPVTKLTIPSMGTFQLYPENNYSASVNYRQLVYDFGRTRQNIELENEGKAIDLQTLAQIKQKLSLIALNNFYTLVYLQAAIQIKEEQLVTLKEHLDYIEKMMATGSVTEFHVLTTKVKISTVESQKVDLVAALTAQQASLNSLIGNAPDSKPIVKNELTVELPVIPSDSILSYAYHNRDEVLLDKNKTSLAQLRYGLVQLHNKPVISIQASGGLKNGYIPDLNKVLPNYIVGMGIRIPLLDGIKNRYILAQAQSAITSLSFESESTKRKVSNEIYEAEAYMIAAAKKISQFELQLSQALKAYSLAETSFSAGTITNLDLLDANTAVSESRLMLLKARIDYAASIYKLKVALGERIY